MATTATTTAHVPSETLPPPVSERANLVGWLRRNLFNTPVNSLLTILLGIGVVMVVVPLVNWAVLTATWWADNKEGCAAGGGRWSACAGGNISTASTRSTSSGGSTSPPSCSSAA